MPQGSIIFTFTDGYLEGSRALRRLTRALTEKKAHSGGTDLIHSILMECGEGSRLIDDRSLLLIKSA
jgi:hypothetical protein